MLRIFLKYITAVKFLHYMKWRLRHYHLRSSLHRLHDVIGVRNYVVQR